MEHVAPLLHPGAGGLHSIGALQGELQVAPHEVTLAGALYLDDLCAHFGGEEGGEGLCNDGAAGQDFDALKRAESLGALGDWSQGSCCSPGLHEETIGPI